MCRSVRFYAKRFSVGSCPGLEGQSFNRQESGDRGLHERSLDPAHRPAATGARVEIGAENVTQKPGPTVTWWRSVVVRVVVAEGGQAELITAGRRRPSLGRVAQVCGDDFPAQRRVARKNAKIPQKMQSRRWHRSHQAREQVERFEHQRARAVSPHPLQLEFEPTVRATRQALLGKRRTGDVAA